MATRPVNAMSGQPPARDLGLLPRNAALHSGLHCAQESCSWPGDGRGRFACTDDRFGHGGDLPFGEDGSDVSPQFVGDAVPGPDGGGGQAGGDQVETGRITSLDATPTLLA